MKIVHVGSPEYGKRVEYDAEPELDPGAHYRNKAREATAVQKAILQHGIKCEECHKKGYCQDRLALERQLEMARYTGD